MKKHIQENRMTLTKIAARLTMLLNLDKFRYQAASMVELVYYLFVSVALICFLIYLRKIILSKICILHCLVTINSVRFKPSLFRLVKLCCLKSQLTCNYLQIRYFMVSTIVTHQYVLQ